MITAGQTAYEAFVKANSEHSFLKWGDLDPWLREVWEIAASSSQYGERPKTRPEASPGQVAYNAYLRRLGWNFPPWDRCDPKVKEAWESAADSVLMSAALQLRKEIKTEVLNTAIPEVARTIKTR